MTGQSRLQKSLFTAGWLSALLTTQAMSQTTPADEVIVSATRTPTRIDETGSSVSVILAEDIRARQYAFTADALRDAPGVTIARNSAFGGVASARVRGASSGQTLVVIDGIVVNDPTAPQGGFNFANLDVVDIERIEVLRGPQSILYGADAIGGVIYITTKRSTNRVQGFAEGGSFATFRGGASASAGNEDAFGRLTVSGITTDGISRAASGVEDDGFRSVAGSFKGGLRLNENWSAELIARIGDAQADIDGFPPPNFTIADTAEIETTTDYAVAARLLQNFGQFNGALTVSFNAIDRRNENNGAETFSADGDRLSADYLGECRINESLRVVAGGEFEQSTARVSGVDDSLENGAAFAMLEFSPAPKLTVSAGARRDEYSNFEGATTARAAVAWTPVDGLVLRSSWGQGFRAPTLFELNFSQFGVMPNPDLRPERANGFDIGAEKRFALDDRNSLTLRTTFFHTRVEDQIDFDFAGNGYFNIDETRSRGLETEALWRAGDRLSVHLIYNLIDAIDRQTNTQLLRQPKHSGTAIVSVSPVEGLSLSSTITINGEENDFPAPNDSFVRVDLRGAYAFSEAFEIYGRIENATDTAYQDVSGFGEPGLSAFGGVRVRL
ncbi:MAG: TonB-dependent receptor plug domain-containing protein [Hyphococcus sp.]